MAAQSLGGEKARDIPNLTEFMLLNTSKSFKIQTKSRPQCKGYWSWDFIARCKSVFSKTCSRSLVPHLKYFMCAEWICWLPVAFVNYEFQISWGLDPAEVVPAAPLQALNGGQLCFTPEDCPDLLFDPPFWTGEGGAAWFITGDPSSLSAQVWTITPSFCDHR